MKNLGKLQLVWIPSSCGAVNGGHYDLCTIEKQPCNVACIKTDKHGAKLLRDLLHDYNLWAEEK